MRSASSTVVVEWELAQSRRPRARLDIVTVAHGDVPGSAGRSIAG
jgi:hypothetical protein